MECCGHIQEILIDDIKITYKAKPHFLQHSVTPRKKMKMDILQTSNPWMILFADPAHLDTTTADMCPWRSTKVSGLAPFPSGKYPSSISSSLGFFNDRVSTQRDNSAEN